jgi:transposase-like protein
MCSLFLSDPPAMITPWTRTSWKTLITDGVSIERIAERFDLHPSMVGYWLEKHGLSAAHAAKHRARGGIARKELERLIAGGGTVRSMAGDLGVSVATVRHWLRRYGLETRATAARKHASAARANGQRTITRVCRVHGPTRFILYTGGTYRCARCRQAAVTRRRRAVREMIVKEAGGRCLLCGYDEYVGALQFHHLDPAQKKFGLSGRGLTRSLERMRAEAQKCVLLCANCHAAVEAGVRTLPLEFAAPLKGAPRVSDDPG